MFETNKEWGRGGQQLRCCQLTTGDCDINLNILFKAFLHHGALIY